jgi:hypothetical protein
MPEIGMSSLMSGDWKRNYGANCDTGTGESRRTTVKPRKPNATAPVVDSTAEPLVVTASQTEVSERGAVGPQFVGHDQLGRDALLSEQLAHEP